MFRLVKKAVTSDMMRRTPDFCSLCCRGRDSGMMKRSKRIVAAGCSSKLSLKNQRHAEKLRARRSKFKADAMHGSLPGRRLNDITARSQTIGRPHSLTSTPFHELQIRVAECFNICSERHFDLNMVHYLPVLIRPKFFTVVSSGRT